MPPARRSSENSLPWIGLIESKYCYRSGRVFCVNHTCMHGNETTDSSSGVGSKGKGKAVIPRAHKADISDRFNTCTSKKKKKLFHGES